MSATNGIQIQQFDIAAIMGGLYGDGIIGLKGAFEHPWVQELAEDLESLFQEALKRPGGAVGRGEEGVDGGRGQLLRHHPAADSAGAGQRAS